MGRITTIVDIIFLEDGMKVIQDVLFLNIIYFVQVGNVQRYNKLAMLSFLKREDKSSKQDINILETFERVDAMPLCLSEKER